MGLARGFGEPIKAARTLAIDFDTCERLVETGSVTPEDAARINESDASESSPPAAPEGPRPSKAYSGSGVLASTVNTAKFTTTWEDLAGIDVNWVRSEVKWTVDDGQVTFRSGQCQLYWRSGTGWRKGTSDACASEYLGGQTQIVVNRAYQEFNNNVFPCPTISGVGAGADTAYFDNKVGGTTIGSWGRSTTRASGDCAYLLDYTQVLH